MSIFFSCNKSGVKLLLHLPCSFLSLLPLKLSLFVAMFPVRRTYGKYAFFSSSFIFILQLINRHFWPILVTQRDCSMNCYLVNADCPEPIILLFPSLFLYFLSSLSCLFDSFCSLLLPLLFSISLKERGRGVYKGEIAKEKRDTGLMPSHVANIAARVVKT